MVLALIWSDRPELIEEIATLVNGQAEYDILVDKDNEDKVAPYKARELKVYESKVMEAKTAAELLESLPDSYQYVIIGATTLGREAAAVLCQDKGWMMASETISFKIKEDGVLTSRYFYGGKTVLVEESHARVITVMAGLTQPKEIGPSQKRSYLSFPEAGDARVRVVERLKKESGAVDITKADIIVSVGRGLARKEGLDLIRKLSGLLGAEIAGSRPVCSDYHWLEEDRQVGLSGKRVKPKIYMAIGISGQIQHVVGMRESKLVIAINKDKQAPIIEESDYVIIGDLYQVVPRLIKELGGA